jgi:hypothetical protein
VRDGHLQDPWTTGDLLNTAELAREVPGVTLRTQPPNRSVSLPGLGLGTGANVAGEADARFWRVGRRGNALLYSVRDGAGLKADAWPVAAVEVAPEAQADNTTVEAIVESDHTAGEVRGNGTEYLPRGEAPGVLGLLVRQMQQEEAWDERLRNYIWKGCTFEETGDALAGLAWQGSVLARFIRHGIAWTPEDQVRAVTWATDIFRWGGTRQKNPVTWQKVHHTLPTPY